MILGFRWLAFVAGTSLLAGCGVGSGSADHARNADQTRFVSHQYGMVLDYPGGLTVHHEFQPGYFLGTRWNAYAPKNVAGDALLALRLPESNEVTKGILRLGASDAPRAVRHCVLSATAVDWVSRHKAESVQIAGVTFQRVTHSGAGMSHYLQRRSYRAVHDGHCIAIDLIVAGTNPHVYAPPRTPPFSVDAAFTRLTALLDGFRFRD